MDGTDPIPPLLHSLPALNTNLQLQQLPDGLHPTHSDLVSMPNTSEWAGMGSPSTATGFRQGTLKGNFVSSYTAGETERWLDPAKDAFDNAVKVLRKDLSPAEYDMLRLCHNNFNSIADVQKALEEAQVRYQGRSSKSKVGSILASCSSRVVYYTPIFDTLSQQSPEYVSLVWGSFKLFFTIIVNHEELLVEISRAIRNIANVLPRTKLLYELYPTKDMQHGIANVYAKIIGFVLETIKWYKKSKLQHAISAVINPYKISLKGIVDDIAERSSHVDELASTAVKTELRDVHLKVGSLIHENISLKQEVLSMRYYMSTNFQKVTQAMLETRALQNQMIYFQKSQNILFLEWQSESLRTELRSLCREHGSSEEMLKFCRSMRNKRRIRTPTQLPAHQLHKLKDWVKDGKSSLLVAHGRGVRSSSLDFAVDFLDAIIETKAPIVWALPIASDCCPRLTDILHSLMLQALCMSGSTNDADLNMITLQEIRNATSVSHWLHLLERSFRRFENIFVVIDLSLIGNSRSIYDDDRDGTEVGKFIEQLQAMVNASNNRCLKIVLAILSSNIYDQLLEKSDGSLTVSRILTDRGIKQERKSWAPKLRAMTRKQMRVSSNNFRDAMNVRTRNLLVVP